MAERCLKVAGIYLLGWVSLGVIRLVYRAYPHVAETALARWHFALHNIGLPLFMLSLFLMLSGHAEFKLGVIVGAATTVVAITLLVFNLMRTFAGARAIARNEPVDPVLARRPAH